MRSEPPTILGLRRARISRAAGQIADAFVLLASLTLVTLGAVVMFGWVVKSPTIVQLRADWVPMQFNTAFCVMCCGVALGLLHTRHRYSAKIIAVLLAMVATVTLAQYLLDVDLGIDTLFITPFIETGTQYPGRMAPNTALATAMFALGVLLAMSRRPVIGASTAGALPLALGVVPAVGYAMNLEPVNAWGTSTAMAFHTAIGLMIAATGLLVHAYRLDVKRTRWFAIPVAIVLTVGALLLHQTLVTLTDNTLLQWVGLSTALLTSLTTTLAVYFAQTSFHRQSSLAAANEALELRTRELAIARDRFDQLATLDPLTKLLNRRGLKRELRRSVAQADRRNEVLFALMIDLDDFKSINDRFGHAMGDVALQTFASEMSSVLRAGDSCGRLGGDEFLILMSLKDEEGAVVLTERVRNRVNSIIVEWGGGAVRVTASFGLVRVNNGNHTLPELIADAGSQLRQSKRAGKNRISR